MRLLALTLFLALPPLAAAQSPADPPAASTATLAPGRLESSKIRLDAGDASGALADAEAALAHGGGAEAYAARGDAKRALGNPSADVLADYAEAAELDPRFIEKYKGLIAQQQSEIHPNKHQSSGKGLNGVPIAGILGTMAIGGLCLGIAVIMLNARERNIVAPDDEDIKTDGMKNGVGEKPKPADEAPPSPKA